jgi:glycine/serine hydroxymethyltransferase
LEKGIRDRHTNLADLSESLSHGYQTPTKKISMVSSYFETLPYQLDEKTGYIDYDGLEKNAKLYRPKIIVAGASAYPRNIDFARMRKVRRETKQQVSMHSVLNYPSIVDC